MGMVLVLHQIVVLALTDGKEHLATLLTALHFPIVFLVLAWLRINVVPAKQVGMERHVTLLFVM